MNATQPVQTPHNIHTTTSPLSETALSDILLPPHTHIHPGSHSHIPSRHPQRPWLCPSLVQALLCGFILDASLVMRLLRRCCRPDCCAGCGASAPASFLRRADQ